MIGPERVAQATALAAIGDYDELKRVLGELTPVERGELEEAALVLVFHIRELAGGGAAPTV